MRARGDLIEIKSHLVRLIVNKFKSTSLVADGSNDLDDLFSVGIIGLIKAIDSFNDFMSTQFSTYAVRCIENEILMYLRQKKKNKNEISLENEIGHDSEGQPIYIADIIKDIKAEENFEGMLESENMKIILEKLLSEDERLVILLVYGFKGHSPMTIDDVAYLMNVSTPHVRKLLMKSKKKIFKQLN